MDLQEVQNKLSTALKNVIAAQKACDSVLADANEKSSLYDAKLTDLVTKEQELLSKESELKSREKVVSDTELRAKRYNNFETDSAELKSAQETLNAEKARFEGEKSLRESEILVKEKEINSRQAMLDDSWAKLKAEEDSYKETIQEEMKAKFANAIGG